MIWDIIGLVVVTIFIVFLFIASTVLAWEKQDKKYKERDYSHY